MTMVNIPEHQRVHIIPLDVMCLVHRELIGVSILRESSLRCLSIPSTDLIPEVHGQPVRMYTLMAMYWTLRVL